MLRYVLLQLMIKNLKTKKIKKLKKIN